MSTDRIELAKAIPLVVADQRESYPNYTVTEAIDHARNVLVANERDQVPGGVWIGPNDGTPVWRAYDLVLRADEATLAHVVSLARG